MKYKYLLLLIAFLFLEHNSFANGNSRFDKIINAPAVYFQLTGNETIDNMIQNAFRDYWKVNHIVAIAPNTPKKEIIISGGKAPVFLFINSINTRTPGYIDEIAMIMGNSGSFSKGSIDPDAFLASAYMYVPSDKMNLLDMDFAIPLAIRYLNDELMSYKENKKVVDHPSALKEKTLLIPEELTVTTHSGLSIQAALLPVSNLDGYRFKYKIMSNSEIKKIANDSSQNSQYCYMAFVYGGWGFYIYDLDTKELILTYKFKIVGNFSRISKADLEKASDEIDGTPSTVKKKK